MLWVNGFCAVELQGYSALGCLGFDFKGFEIFLSPVQGSQVIEFWSCVYGVYLSEVQGL